MKTYLSRIEALNRYDITADDLDDLIQSEKLDIARFVDQGQEYFIIYDDDLAAYIADRDITPQKFEHLRGNLLGISEAAREYKLNQVTVSRWAQQGKLEIKGRDGQKKLVDEADVAYLAALGRAKRMRPGKKVFD